MKKRRISDEGPVLRRGQIWWADLPPPEGSEPGDRHPVLILQRDAFNRSAIRTVIGVLITSNTGLADLPGNVLLPASTSGLPHESVVNVSQILTVDKRLHITEYAGSVDQATLKSVEDGVRLLLDL